MMHLQTHTDWGTASLTMAWKLTEQEMKERKLDLETFRSRRVIRHAINTEAVLGLTEEQCYDLATFDAHWGANLATRARMRAHAQELLAAAPNPTPTGHVSRVHDFPALCRDRRSRLNPTCRDRSPAARSVSKSGLRRFVRVILLNYCHY